MLEKLKKLLNVKAWIENFGAKLLVDKGVKHGATAIVGLLSSVYFLNKIQPTLNSAGISIDHTKLLEYLTLLFGGAAGLLVNYVQRVLNHED